MTASTAFFHKLYGEKKPRVVYYKRDFIDYSFMLVLSAIVTLLIYGQHTLAFIGLCLCVVMLVFFVLRHGIEFAVPLVLTRPQELLHMLVYKVQNIKATYFVSLGLLLFENWLILLTPNLPHHVEMMRRIALYLFYAHFLSITLFRLAILVDHVVKRELVREVLMQTPWQRVIKIRTNILMEIFHAFCTGVLTHILLIAPWYFVITHLSFSAVFLPFTCLINMWVHRKWYKVYNAWFYRDHWLGHNSELEFVLLHGTHHDAIPCGLIAVAENGLLEGVMRFTIGSPVTFYNPLIACLVYTIEIQGDIRNHQYIPGVFPRLPRNVIEVLHHSTHHYGPLEPYGIGISTRLDTISGNAVSRMTHDWIPDELRNSIRLDEELTGFKWDNPTHRRILSLYDRYQDPPKEFKAHA